MNEALKLDNINKYLESIGIEEKENFLYVQLDEGVANALAKSFILHFGKDKITFIELTLTGDFTNKCFDILREDIISINCKEGMVFNKLDIITKTKRLKLKFNKSIIGSSWQKENLIKLLKNNFKSEVKKGDEELSKDNVRKSSENNNTNLKKSPITPNERNFESADNNKIASIGKLLGIAVSIVLFIFIFIIWPNKNLKSDYSISELMEVFMESDFLISRAGASEKAKDFLIEHEDMFPIQDEEYEMYVNKEIEYKHLTKNIQEVGNEFIYRLGNVVDIKVKQKGGTTYTVVHIGGDKINLLTKERKPGDNYYLVYKGELPNIYSGAYVLFLAIPYEEASFNDVNGETTSVIVCAAGYIGQ